MLSRAPQLTAVFAAVLLALLSPHSSGAQRAGADSARLDSLTILPGVRVLESRDVRRRLPGSAVVVESHSLRQSRVFTTNEALRKVPGVFVRDEEGFGLRPNIGIRGLNPTRSTKVLLLEDGVPLSIAPYGDNASYYHPPIDRIESIEVVKGASQILYGPQTIGGVINYLTPAIPDRPAGLLSLAPGSRHLLNAHARYGGTFGTTGLLVDALRKQGDAARANTRSALTDASLKLLVPLTASQSLSMRANYFAERSQVTYSGLTEAEYAENPLQNPFANDHMALDRGGMAITHRAGRSAVRQLTTTLYGHVVQRDWWRQSSNSTQRPNDRSDVMCAGMANLLTTCGNEGRLRNYRVFGIEPRLSLMGAAGAWQVRTDLGARAHFEQQERRQVNGQFPSARTVGAVTNVNSGTVEDNRRETIGAATWGQLGLTRGAVTVTPGLRVEHVRLARLNRRPTSTNPEGVRGSTSLTQLIPGIGLAVEARGGTTLFTGVHLGFAPPRPEDIISNATGGVVELDAELSWNLEAGVRSRLGTRGSVALTAFRMDFANQIVPASVAGGTGATLTSAGESVHQGAELSLTLDLGRSTGWLSPFVEASTSWTPIARFESAQFVYRGTGGSDVAEKVYTDQNASGTRERISVAGNRLPYAPRWLTTATVGVTTRAGADLRVEAVYIGEQFGDALNTRTTVADGQQGVIPSSLIWNAVVNAPLNRSRTTVFVTIKNVADRRYLVDRSRGLLPGLTRLIQVGVSQGL